jgi:hypothetical protein
MTRLVLLLAVAVAAGTAAGCGPTQAQSQSQAAPLPPMAGKAAPAAASHNAGAMKALPPRP